MQRFLLTNEHQVPPTDISWPATCFAWCATHDSGFNPKTEHNPYGFSDHFLCLTNDLEDTLDFSVICGNSSNYAATASAAKDIPTSTYGHSWSVASWTGSSTTSRYVQGTAVSTVTGSVSSGTKKSSSTMAAVTTGVGTTSTTTTGLSSSLSGTTASSVATASSRSSADGGVSRSNGFLLASMGLLALLGYGW